MALISYVGYATAGCSTRSRPVVPILRCCATPATSSLVPTHAAMASMGTSMPNRLAIHAAAASRKRGLPSEVGYPRSVSDDDSASTTARGGGSHGVPTERSTAPPSWADAISPSEPTLSYG